MVSVFDGYAPIDGGDIVFDNEGMLYLATRAGNGLYEVYPDDVMSDQFIGNIDDLVTGMVLTNGNQLLTSHYGLGNLNLSNLNGSITDINFPLLLDGVPFQHHNGDLAGGCFTTIGNEPELMLSHIENNVLAVYPNPSTGNSEVVFLAHSSAQTVIEIFDLNGKKLTTLFDEVTEEGQKYKLQLKGNTFPNGIYLCKMTTQLETITEKIVIAK
jgi:hypothetical protein